MTPLIPLIIAGYAFYKASEKKAANGQLDIPKPGDATTPEEQAEFDRLIAELAGKPGVTLKDNAPLVATMMLRVSGGEKFAIGMGAMGGKAGLKKKAYALALDVQKKLPGTCPGAPLLLGKPVQAMKSVDGGYRIITTWGASWKPGKAGPVREKVRVCMLGILKKTKIGSRIVDFKAARA